MNMYLVRPCDQSLSMPKLDKVVHFFCAKTIVSSPEAIDEQARITLHKLKAKMNYRPKLSGTGQLVSRAAKRYQTCWENKLRHGF